MQFRVISRNTSVPDKGVNTVYLKVDHWNDYSFITMFEVYVFDENGEQNQLSNVKIGFGGQTEDVPTYSTLSELFTKLPKGYFSLGTDVDYYHELARDYSDEFREEYLDALKDVVHDEKILEHASEESVFQTSHLRSVSINTIEQQFCRVLAGGVPVTDFNFRFVSPDEDEFAGFVLDFDVNAHSKPSSNIHAIIGRNGVGKTTLLNQMIHSIIATDNAIGRFEETNLFGPEPISDDFFSSLVSVSFSAFDPFAPPPEQPDPKKGTCYFYVGLKDIEDKGGTLLKPISSLHEEFAESLKLCLSEPGKLKRWLKAVVTLASDDNFAEKALEELSDLRGEKLIREALNRIQNMSSGHAIVLLTITKLVSRVEEKTLVLFDEPESHLHPPLLSALVRSLSELLHDRNGVAIVATHSPVVLQEIPKSCVWKITRSGLESSWSRPEVETFGENVGLLTRETFGLEVSKSGFNALLQEEVAINGSYEEILSVFDGQVGFEGRAILQSLLHEKSRQNQ
ncbi:AAA family ATPase [Sulfitobacter geojensis]|uniref:AAA family ATPase n=1 Tax=Sulfitobacter geojensis TaxID=1342299 RepID=A0AAE3B803_9RHOB|nr:AAA family ATPase [Sulfitobacter geojensis]MBM1690779.1 AAA family ATPase [Sulfitobacter geojensis]MBM1694845.1 AAA family ATPase [Sulfitobacter geojensis]MBM1707001.1 AAA family ATPase [Sulfitobacter geojensis]MBM1711059.1 AAA family ATPase [Sulfitobacter geojensis]MBM1715125.1 AAA family ATPase [Sulfitobacter geojensis]